MQSASPFNERTNQSLALRDGRTLGFAECGPQDGFLIFELHGLPGSRYECLLFESAAIDNKVRIISIDRPGVDTSSAQLGRTILDHAKDVQVIAAHLGLDAFSVMGVSGGGLYALACAYIIPPSQLKSVAVVAGCGAWNPETCKNMMAANRWMFWALKAAPWAADLFVRAFFGVMLWYSDDALAAKVKQQNESGGNWIMPDPGEKDKEALQDGAMNRVLIAETREHFRQGFSTYTEDGRILGGDFGFDLADVLAARVDLWYGKRDLNVPPEIGEDYAKRLKGKARLRIEDETHLSLVKNCGSAIIQNLIERVFKITWEYERAVGWAGITKTAYGPRTLPSSHCTIGIP